MTKLGYGPVWWPAVASLQDLETAELAMTTAVRHAVETFLDLVRATVFQNPTTPNLGVYPAQAWPQIFTEQVLPVLAAQFEAQLRAEGVTDEAVIRAMVATFITQVTYLVDDPRIPARVLEEISRTIASPEFQIPGDKAAIIAALLVGTAAVWLGMIGVTASNMAALATNSATNQAAQIQVNQGKQVFKTWRAVDDSRTRPTHAAADNTRVPFQSVFTVGGFPLRFPHDPFGPPQEVINCRCVLSFEVA